MAEIEIRNAQYDEYQAYVAKLQELPLQQSWAFGEAMASVGCRANRILLSSEEGNSYIQYFTRTYFKFFPITFVIKPNLHNGSETKIIKAFRSYNKTTKRKRMIWVSNGVNTSIQGMKRIMTGDSNVWWNIADDETNIRSNLDGKWRNALKKAEASDITVKKGGKLPEQYNWLLKEHNDQQRERHYLSLPAHIVTAYAALSNDKRPVLSLTAMQGKDKIAGVLFLIHEPSATYHVSWTSDAGKACNANNLLLWEGVKELKKRGIISVDLGAINTKDNPGIARFKLGTGGVPKTYGGSFMPRFFF